MSMPKPDEEAIFQAARQLAPSARSAYVKQACGDDLALRSRVEALLGVLDDPGAFLETPPDACLAIGDNPIVEKPGAMIGPYRLLEQIGEGGFGVVFLAEQQQPIRRRVALKVIKPGMDTRQVIARFEAERQALALMEHPNIARVLDGGETASGRPFFVMELVGGVPITEYCDRHHLPVPQRLELFASVCQAVQHAHQKGIIHRDLKPSNILVTLHDGAPVIKVIDFGIAKAMGQQLTEKTVFTSMAQMIGTPLYMSPEQAEMGGLDVDTRSDIYSLGVLLYELATGTTPFDRERLKSAAFDELRRIIREEEPAKPSTRIDNLASDTVSTATANRRIDRTRLSRLLRGELDWIVMKSLEKDRTRRYETASAMARDIERYLGSEPVEAGPPSARYRLRKLAYKHRKVLAATLAFAILLLAGTAVSTWQAVRARRAEWAATAEREKAVAAAAAERLAKESAEKRLAQIEKGNEILGSIFHDLDPNAEEMEGKPLRALLGERLDEAAKELEGEAVGDPVAVARLQMTLGASLLGLGKPEMATALLTKARSTFAARLGRDDPVTLTCMTHLALSYRDAGKSELALPLLEETLDLTSRTLGPDHADTLGRMFILASVYRHIGKLDEAATLLEKTLDLTRTKLGPDHADTIACMRDLGWIYRYLGKVDRALPLLEEALVLSKKRFGPEHPDTLATMGHLATAYRVAGKLDLAVALLEETLKLRREKLGPDHQLTLTSMNNLGVAYQEAGKPELALPLYETALKLKKARLGKDHPDVLACMHNLGVAYQEAHKPELAVAMLEEALGLITAKLGPEHLDTSTTMYSLALAYQATGKLEPALSMLQRVAESMERHKFEHERAGLYIEKLSLSYEQRKQYDQAEIWRRKWVAVLKEKVGPESLACAAQLALLGQNLIQQEKWVEAESVVRECLEIRSLPADESTPDDSSSDPSSPRDHGTSESGGGFPSDSAVALIKSLERLAEHCESRGEQADAEQWRSELQDERERQKR